MKLKELIEREPIEVTGLADSYDGILELVPELSRYAWECNALRECKDVELRVYAHQDVDYRRYQQLGAFYYNGHSVLVYQIAGREGRDYQKVFVIDKQAYADMVQYVRSKMPVDVPDETDWEEDIEDLTYFYGHDVFKPYPQY